MVGFLVSILLATLLALAARAIGWVELSDVGGRRPQTDFIYQPDKWSFIVAIIAAAAGALGHGRGRLGDAGLPAPCVVPALGPPCRSDEPPDRAQTCWLEREPVGRAGLEPATPGL